MANKGLLPPSGQVVKDKLKGLIAEKEAHDDLDSSLSFNYNFALTKDLRALKQSTAVQIPQAAFGGEGASLWACQLNGVSKTKRCLNLQGEVDTLYIRDAYDALYDDIQRLWKTDTMYGVVLLGNAGSGKSWYQLYVLRRLLRLSVKGSEYTQDADNYDFVFRRVGTQMFLIDLKDCIVYRVNSFQEETMLFIKRCLYFFEPGREKDMVPEELGLPSLVTLSPYKKRIAEYLKGHTLKLYFWPWSFSELHALLTHAVETNQIDKSITFDEFMSSFHKFGGIVRHHLVTGTKKTEAEEELDARVLHVDLAVLQSKAANVDRDVTGDNVSGYILSFDGKRKAMEMRKEDPGRTKDCYFNAKVLRYTSAFVEEKAEALLDVKPLEYKMGVVLDRLNDRQVDLSGKNLEVVATEFLRRGQEVQWEVKRAGVPGWAAFTTNKRKVTKQYDISALLTNANEILVPANPSFPVADLVFSGWGNQNVYVFQCTWQPSHPFTIRALYELRAKKLMIDATKVLVVIMVVPGQEDAYGAKQEGDFLQGSVDVPLRYSANEEVQPQVLQQMWLHTQVKILRPKNSDWKSLIGNFLVPSSNAASAAS